MSDLNDTIALAVARAYNAGYEAGLVKPHRQEGAQAERERIVRLLIDKAIESRLNLRGDEADVFDFAVAIIKAGQK